MSTTTNIQDRAGDAAEWFETKRRGDSEEYFTTLKDGAPEWVRELVYAAHHGWSDFLPDDYRYKWAAEACEHICEADDPDDSAEFADQAVDVYTHERLKWLASNLNRPAYCDEAASEFGYAGDIIAAIGLGQYMEASEVYGLVLDALRDSAGVES